MEAVLAICLHGDASLETLATSIRERLAEVPLGEMEGFSIVKVTANRQPGNRKQWVARLKTSHCWVIWRRPLPALVARHVSMSRFSWDQKLFSGRWHLMFVLEKHIRSNAVRTCLPQVVLTSQQMCWSWLWISGAKYVLAIYVYHLYIYYQLSLLSILFDMCSTCKISGICGRLLFSSPECSVLIPGSTTT